MTSPDRPTTPTSTGDMLARTHRRAEQLRRRRRGVVTGVAAAVVVIAIVVPLLTRSPHRSRVVGVTGGPTSVTTAPGTATAPGTTTAPGTAAVTTPGTTIPAAPSIPAPPTTATTAPPRTPPASVPECATSQLGAALTNPNGSAGSVGYALRFVNTSGAACSLTGYPGVSYRSGATRTLVGAPARRDPLNSVVTVTLRPGQAADATLIEVDSLNYPPASCQLTGVDGLWVYPPDQTAPLFVSQSTQACSNPADPVLMVGPIQPS